MKLNTLRKRVEAQGGQLFLVGGAVRDKVMGIVPHDLDFVFTGVWDISALGLGNTVGKDFPVFIVEIDGVRCEVAAARTERSTGPTDKDFDIDASASVTILEDLSRRDLTMNAMAMLVGDKDFTIIDPFGGREDIDMKVLRRTTNAFTEDPARVFRLARFAAQFPEFKVSRHTEMLCMGMLNDILVVPAERVQKEMMKALVCPKPSQFFTVLRDCGCLHRKFFAELCDTFVPDRHDGTAFNHTMRCIDFQDNRELGTQFGLLCHDLGKGRTAPENHPSHYAHDALGVDVVKDFCSRLRISNHFRDIGVACARDHMKMKLTKEMKPAKIFKMLMNNTSLADVVNGVTTMDSLVSNYEPPLVVIERCCLNQVLISYVKLSVLNVTGKQLLDEGFQPGPAFGHELYNRRLSFFRKKRTEYMKNN